MDQRSGHYNFETSLNVSIRQTQTEFLKNKKCPGLLYNSGKSTKLLFIFQKSPDFFKIMSGILDPGIPTFRNSDTEYFKCNHMKKFNLELMEVSAV